METYWLKLLIFPTLSALLFGTPLPMFPLEFRGEVNCEETSIVMGYDGAILQ